MSAGEERKERERERGIEIRLEREREKGEEERDARLRDNLVLRVDRCDKNICGFQVSVDEGRGEAGDR